MGNRSRYVALGAIAAGALGARTMRRRQRRAHTKAALEGVGETILPTTWAGVHPDLGERVDDKAHAPGHQHLYVQLELVKPGRGRSRRQRHWMRQAHGKSSPDQG